MMSLEVVFELDLLLKIPVLCLQMVLQGLDVREELGVLDGNGCLVGLVEGDFGALHFTGACRHRLGHLIDVAVHAGEHHLNVCRHRRLLCG
jgi:hypothetical protein